MGYYFDLVFPPKVTTQDEVMERLRQAGAEKFPPVPDPHYPEPGPGDDRMLWWKGRRNGRPVLDIRAKPWRYAELRAELQAEGRPIPPEPLLAWGDDAGWVSIRTSWATGEHIYREILDLLDLCREVGARLWDGQTREFITLESAEEAGRKYLGIAEKVGGLFGAVDPDKHREALKRS